MLPVLFAPLPGRFDRLGRRLARILLTRCLAVLGAAALAALAALALS